MFLEISQASGLCNFIRKETQAQVFSCEFCKISKNTFFYRTPLVVASEPFILITWYKLSFSTWPQEPRRRNSKPYSTNFHESISQKYRSIYLPNLYKKKQGQDTTIKFIKTSVKFVCENNTDQIRYRLVSDEPNVTQHYRKSLSNWTTQQKNWILIFEKSEVKHIKENLNITLRCNSVH